MICKPQFSITFPNANGNFVTNNDFTRIRENTSKISTKCKLSKFKCTGKKTRNFAYPRPFCKYCFAIVVINSSKVLYSFQRNLNLLCQQKLSCEEEIIAALRICHFLLEDSNWKQIGLHKWNWKNPSYHKRHTCDRAASKIKPPIIEYSLLIIWQWFYIFRGNSMVALCKIKIDKFLLNTVSHFWTWNW